MLKGTAQIILFHAQTTPGRYASFYRLFAPFLLGFVAIGSVAAEPADVSRLLLPIVERSKVRAMVALVVEGEQVVMRGAAGVRRAGGTEGGALAQLFWKRFAAAEYGLNSA